MSGGTVTEHGVTTTRSDMDRNPGGGLFLLTRDGGVQVPSLAYLVQVKAQLSSPAYRIQVGPKHHLGAQGCPGLWSAHSPVPW